MSFLLSGFVDLSRYLKTCSPTARANRVYKIAQITDGTSNTAISSERLLGDFSNSIVTDQRDIFDSPNSPLSLDDAYTGCLAAVISDLANQGAASVNAPWYNGGPAVAMFKVVSPPNTRSCYFHVVNRLTIPPTSLHLGGVNVGMADGSVRFIKNSINLAAWRALGSMNGGEVISADSY
jgi:prepilin-type processing-associated H-X9-DG protein